MNKLIATGTLVLVFGSGAWMGYSAAPSDTSASIPTPAIPTLVNRERGSSDGRAEVDYSALRALVREEMNAALMARTGSNPAASGAAPATKVAPPEPVTPEMQARRRDAQEQIDAMVVQGTWGNEQRFNFQQRLAVLDPEQKEHALQQLTMAINNGTLQLSTDGPPF
jgi:hypothetical protein